MYAQPEAWNALAGGLVDATAAYLSAQAAAGAQALQVFDSWVGALSPRDYRARVAPHMRRLFASLPDHVPVIHFGTGTAGILPSHGGGGRRRDRRRLADRHGSRARQSAVGRCRAIWTPRSPPVPGSARRRKHGRSSRAWPKPGHVFNLGHGVLPGTPIENLQRLVEVVHGWDLSRIG